MSAQRTATGLILQVRDHKEKDRWVTLLTPGYGKLRVLAKNVRTLQSRRRSALQVGTVVRISWVDRGEVHILTEALYEESLLQADATLEQMRDFWSVLEAVYHLALEEIEQDEFYTVARQLLRYVGTPEYHRGQVRHGLQTLAQLQGIESEFAHSDESITNLLEDQLGRRLHSFAFLQV